MHTLADIADHIGAQTVGNVELEITGLGSLQNATPSQVSHLSSPSYRPLLKETRAGAVILKAQDAQNCPVPALIVDNPYLAFASVSQLFKSKDHLNVGRHPSALIGDDCQIDAGASIGAGVVIGNGCSIGPGVRIFPYSSLGERCVLGADVTLHARSTLYNDVKVGARSILHSGCVIGADGFGYTPDQQGHLHEIAQLGGVWIGEDVSVGASSTIDCGALEDTVIEDGVKIDNQVQVGHNCRVGAHSLLCGCVGIAGSSVIGRHCVLAGGVGVGGSKPVTLCDHVMVTAYTPVTQSITTPGVYSGTVVVHEHSLWRRNALRFSALDQLFKRVKSLEILQNK